MIVKREPERFPWEFILLTYAFSWLLWIPTALAARGVGLPPGLVEFLNSPWNPAAFGPTLMAFLLAFKQVGWAGVKELLRSGVDLGFRKIWLLPILILPVLIFGGATLLSVLWGATELDLSVVSQPPVAIIAVIVILLTGGPLQEEFGWRGYALPRLQQRYSAFVSSVILGIVWWLWHLPLVFIPGRFMTGSLWLFGLLGIEIVLTSVLFTWVFDHTGGSVLGALLMHTAMNWSIWVLLPGMEMNVVILGLACALLFVVVAVVVRVDGTEKWFATP